MRDTLPETMQSLFAIRNFFFEIVIVNDGSTDATEKVIKHWQNKSKKYPNILFQSNRQENMGRAGALNKGAQMAKGEYLSFVDADDVIDSDELLRLWNCTKSDKKELILGQFKIETESGTKISNRALGKDITGEELIKRLAFSPISPLHLNAFLIKKTYFLSINGLDMTNLKSEDKDLLIRLLRGTQSMKICDTFHYIYRKHNLSRWKLAKKRFEWFFYRQKMIQKNFSGFTKIGSMVVQAFYDIVKLFYELFFKYRL